MPKVKPLKNTIKPAADQHEAEKLLDSIGMLQDRVSSIEDDLSADVRAAKEKHQQRAKPLLDEIDTLFAQLQGWADIHREDLTDGGKRKTVKLATGEIRWRKTPPSVSLTKVADVIQRLKDAGLQQYLRSKEEVNKDAILADPDPASAIRGIKVSSREEFVAVPHRTQLERATPSGDK